MPGERRSFRSGAAARASELMPCSGSDPALSSGKIFDSAVSFYQRDLVLKQISHFANPRVRQS